MGVAASFAWKVMRVLAMSPGEVLYRLYKTSSWAIQRLRHRPVLVIEEEFEPQAAGGETSRFYIDTDEKTRETYLSTFPAELKSTLAAAENIVRNELVILGLGNYQFKQKVDWHAALMSGECWPRSFYADIKFRDRDDLGDIRIAWELNRHHHLVLLAKAYYLTGNQRYFRKLQDLFLDWVKENPVGFGIQWVSAMELAIRVQSWLWCYHLLQPETPEVTELKRLLLRAINQHCRHIARNLSLYSSANNHLIVEACSLAITAILLPRISAGKNWFSLALKRLGQEVKKQVHSDGVDAEQAIHYQAFVTEALLLLLLVSRRNQVELPVEIESTVQRMCGFLRSIIDSKGNVPAIGDSDDGHILNMAGHPINSYLFLLHTAAVVFNKSEFKVPGFDFNEHAYWLLGSAGIGKYRELETGEPHASECFKHGGYSVLRSGKGYSERVIVFYHAPLGYGSLAAHGHADALSVTLSVGGYPVLTDPGTYIYNVQRKWRDYFRKTQNHNTICLDNKDQSKIEGPFLWSHKARSQLHLFCSCESKDEVIASHNGYLPMRHQRRIRFFKPDLIVINDSVYSGSRVPVETTLNFHKDLGVEPQTNGAIAVTPGQDKVFIYLLSDCGIEVGLRDAWASYQFASMVPVKQLKGKGYINGRSEIILLISINKPLDAATCDYSIWK